MKRVAKSELGVTLLEILLVLAVAAMIIIMSIRYYQSAVLSQQTNNVLSEVTAITAAANQISGGTGSFSGITGSTIANLLPGGTSGAYGGNITTAASVANGFTATIGSLPTGVCPAVAAQLPKITGAGGTLSGSCGTGGSALAFTFTLTY